MQARQKAADVRSGQKQTWLHTWIVREKQVKNSKLQIL